MTTPGNVTRDQYLSWIDSADAAGNSDASSVQTNRGSDEEHSGDYYSASDDDEHHQDDDDDHDDDGTADMFESLAADQTSEVASYLSLPERCRLGATCRAQHALRATHLDGTVTCLSEQAGHGLSGLFLTAVTATPDWLDEVAALRRSRVLQFSRLVGLRTLELGQLGTDEFLRILSGGGRAWLGDDDDNDDGAGGGDGNDRQDGSGGGEGGSSLLLPNLTHLSLVRSRAVTDGGLLVLGPGRGDSPHRIRSKLSRTSLRTIDVTFCPNVTYVATVELCSLLPTLKFVRRQPEWLDGHFETPFAGGTVESQAQSSGGRTGDRHHQPEVHTYWPDGTFAFGRSSQASGFVTDLFEWTPGNPDHLGDKLQYNDFEVPQGWPAWTRYSYRPGVSLLRVPDEEEEVVRTSADNGKSEGREAKTKAKTVIRSVLVAQCRRGLRPPRTFPTTEQLDHVPLGESRFLTHDGVLLGAGGATNNNGHSDGGGGDDDSPRAVDSRVMVSRMRVRPLSENEMVPPRELTQRNLAFVREMEAARDEAPDLAEDILQAALSASDDER